MQQRPVLDKTLSSETFCSFYYLKEELTAFCRQNGLPTCGGKLELTQRVARFLATGEVTPPPPAPKRRAANRRALGELTEATKIEPDFVCSQVHRVFFKEKIGRGFSFNVAFQNWLKENTGKTYGEAIEAYHRIVRQKRAEPTAIDRQFEYNTYIRDFFADNQGQPLQAAIRCWNYKKALPGHNRYERTDLAALE